jgi:hypothetical protein
VSSCNEPNAVLLLLLLLLLSCRVLLLVAFSDSAAPVSSVDALRDSASSLSEGSIKVLWLAV